MLFGGSLFSILMMNSLGRMKESWQNTLSAIESLPSMSLPRKERRVWNLGERLRSVSARVYFLEIKAIYFIYNLICASKNGSTSNNHTQISIQLF